METIYKNMISEKDFNTLKTAYLYFNKNVYLEFLDKYSLKYNLSLIELDDMITENVNEMLKFCTIKKTFILLQRI
jgi:hypothetical protein